MVPVRSVPDRSTSSRVSRRLCPRAEHGQALPLMAGVVALVAVLTLGVVRVGEVVTDRARAHTAADAAALAGASGGRAMAEEVAVDNGGDLVAFVHLRSEVEVTVRVGGVEAIARARLAW